MATTSPIDKLPAELLEKILQETISDIATKYDCVPDHDRVFRCQSELNSGAGLAVQALQIRLINRKFRDLSWRAFGRVLGATIFDICSRESVNSLHAISAQPALVPWVQRLTFTCNTVDVTWIAKLPSNHPDNDRWEELQIAMDNEKVWVPDTFCGFWEDFLQDDDSLSIEELVRLTPSSSLQQFKNVDGITYFWDEDVLPQCYKAVLCGYDTAPEPNEDRASQGEARGAHCGLRVVMEALYSTGIRPRSLDLAVELVDPHVFVTSVPKGVLSDICRNVETLTIRDRYCPINRVTGQFYAWPRVPITMSLFPALRSLTVDHHDWYPKKPISFPLPNDVLNLTHITIIDGNPEDSYMGPFLEHYGVKLERLHIECTQPRCFDAIANQIGALNLDVLSIRQGSDHDWTEALEQSNWHSIVDRKSWYISLPTEKKVLLEPPMYRTYLERVKQMIIAETTERSE